MFWLNCLYWRTKCLFIKARDFKTTHILDCIALFLGDVFLMTIGVLGLGTLIAELPVVSFIISLLGAIFLLSYGSRSFISVFKSGEYLVASGENATSLKGFTDYLCDYILKSSRLY